MIEDFEDGPDDRWFMLFAFTFWIFMALILGWPQKEKENNMATKEQKSIECQVVNVYDENISQNGKSKVVIRTVRWVVDGKSYPMLEKRDFFNSDNGFKTGKAKGLNSNDLALIQKNWSKILSDLGAKTQSVVKPQETEMSPVNEFLPDEDF